LPFLADDGAAVLPRDVEVARGQRAAEHDAARVLRDVDEAADADDPVAEAADVDVALAVDLGERQKCQVEPAAVVEVELRRLLDHRGEVLPAARVAPVIGAPPMIPCSLVRIAASSTPSSAAIVDSPVDTPAPRLQIAPGTAPSPRGARSPCAVRAAAAVIASFGDAQLARVARVVVGRVGLALLGVDDDEVDEDARDLHVLAVQRVAPRPCA
jgi:hypothetical protein